MRARAGRACLPGAAALEEEILLRAIPKENLDPVVQPGAQDAAPHPAHPMFASIAMGAGI